jgi:hypothetical protein
MKQEMTRYSAGSALLLMAIFVTGCASSLYGWQVRTNSTPVADSFNPTLLEQQSIALYGAVTLPALRGDEVALSHYLAEIIHKVMPKWKVVVPQELTERINKEGLAGDYTRMRTDYEISNILDGGTLRKISTAIGARYVFLPRLAAFSQTMTDRWKFPPFDLRMMQTRSSNIRISLQLWDATTGEVVWASMAETTMENEALSQDPVYLEDIARVTLGSMLADFLNGRTASKYTAVNKFLNDLVQESMPTEKSDQQGVQEPAKKTEK